MSIDKDKDPNLLFNMRLDGGETPLRVSLSKKYKELGQSQVSKQGNTSKSVAKMRRPSDEIIPSSLAGIQVFDLGQIKSGGVYVDLPFNLNTGLTIDTSGGTPIYDYSPFTLSNWGQLYDLIATVPHTDWATNYKQIPFLEGGKYGVSEYQGRGSVLLDGTNVDPANKLQQPDNPEWKSKGLKPIEDYIEIFPTGGLALIFKTADTTHYKVTASHDYSAPATTITFKGKKTNIFLMPLIVFSMAVQEVGIDANYRHAELYSYWTLKPRDLWLERTLRKNAEAIPTEVPAFEGYFLTGSLYQSTGAWMYDVSHIGTSFANEWITWMKSQSAAQLWVQRGTVSSGVSYGFEPLSNFPFTGTGPQASVANINFYHLRSPNFEGLPDVGDDAIRFEGEGLLLGVIQQGSNFYYVWTKTEFDDITFWDSLRARTSPES